MYGRCIIRDEKFYGQHQIFVQSSTKFRVAVNLRGKDGERHTVWVSITRVLLCVWNLICLLSQERCVDGQIRQCEIQGTDGVGMTNQEDPKGQVTCSNCKTRTFLK